MKMNSLKRLLPALLIALLVFVIAGCGDDDNDAANKPKTAISVSAAASLTDAFEEIGEDFPDARVNFQFAGSDALAAQIENGVRPEVFAAANTKLPDQLAAKGLVEKPVAFATNTLVIAVPKGSDKIKSIDDLAGSGVTIATGSKSVPVGSYTRKVLAELPPATEKAILANIKSQEPDVKGVVGKVATGSVDAGFVYITDVDAADDDLSAVMLPDEIKPTVVYSAAVVKGSQNIAIGRKFIQYLLTPESQKELADEGFGPPPQ